MAFSETWLTCWNSNLYNIDGFKLESAYRTMYEGGVVLFYVVDYLACTARIDVDLFNHIMESKFVEIEKIIQFW